MSRLPIRYQAAIVEQHHVLLLRVHDIFTGATYWIFPGGGPLPGETAAASVQREVLEETYLDVEVQRFLFSSPDGEGGMYEDLHTYLCRVRGGTARPGVEPEVDTPDHTTIQELAWFDLRSPGAWPPLLSNDRSAWRCCVGCAKRWGTRTNRECSAPGWCWVAGSTGLVIMSIQRRSHASRSQTLV